MRRPGFVLAVVVTVASILLASNSNIAQAPKSFEVASVRLSPAPGYTSISPFPADKFIARSATLKFLMSMAYGCDSNRIEGGPAWVEARQYDVVAKVDDDKQLTFEQMRPLLQRLLEERFHLKTHRETKLLHGYALIVAKGGPKLEASKNEQQPHGQILPDGLQGWGMTTGSFASMLALPAERPVVDETGLKGTFDLKLNYAPLSDAGSTLPSLFTALQEQLGLKLVSRRVAVEILVIDSVNQAPTDN